MYASSSVYFAQTQTPLGEVLLRAYDGALSGLHFLDQSNCPRLPLNTPVFKRTTRDARIFPSTTRALFEHVFTQLDRWFLGHETSFDVPLHLEGTVFQQQVWRALLQIPFGTVVTYGDISLRVTGARTGCRAVGAAIGKNPVSIIVPCHRVVGANGKLTGFSGGLDRKAALLAHEGR